MKRLLKKLLSLSLGITLIGGTVSLLPVIVPYTGISVNVSAADIISCGDYQYRINNDETVTITKYTGVGGEVVIPDTIDEKSVTSIGNYAFRNCTDLTSITIPDSVTLIGDSAFYRCTGLTSVTISNSVKSIGGSAFFYCTGLTRITIPDSVTSIGSSAFYDCTSLTSVVMGNNIMSIGDWAFYNCKNL